MALENGLLLADVMHERHLPKHHKLRYTVFYLAFPLSRLKDIACRLLSLEHFNLYSYYERDHGFGGLNNETWIRGLLAEWNLAEANGEVVLVTMPRVLGYGFNPVSFWFCLDREGGLRAVISEVTNTFRERHCYVSFHDDRRPITQDDVLESRKMMHVSPFFGVEGHYRYRFAYKTDKIGVWIDYYQGDDKMLSTSMIGKRKELSDYMLIKSFWMTPFVTLKVIGLIHYHALRLVAKGIRYRRKPTPPLLDVTR